MNTPTKMMANPSLEMDPGQECQNPLYPLGFALKSGVYPLPYGGACVTMLHQAGGGARMGIWIELGMFALVFVFAIHQWHDLKKEKAKREAARQKPESSIKDPHD
jgi:hypothetical protein